jgi:hypothetical protein
MAAELQPVQTFLSAITGKNKIRLTCLFVEYMRGRCDKANTIERVVCTNKVRFIRLSMKGFSAEKKLPYFLEVNMKAI